MNFALNPDVPDTREVLENLDLVSSSTLAFFSAKNLVNSVFDSDLLLPLVLLLIVS